MSKRQTVKRTSWPKSWTKLLKLIEELDSTILGTLVTLTHLDMDHRHAITKMDLRTVTNLLTKLGNKSNRTWFEDYFMLFPVILTIISITLKFLEYTNI